MNTIVLDTETTGLPTTKGFNNYYDPILTAYYDRSRVIELGYLIYSPDQKELCRRNFLIKPDNFKVTNSHIHGITLEMLQKDGISILDALEILECDMIGVKTLVAHNLKFDYNILLSECYRYGKLTLVNKLKKFNQQCTMEMGKKMLNQKKFPTLKILYSHFNSENLDNTLIAHRALTDTIMCADCYWKMKSIEVVNTNITKS